LKKKYQSEDGLEKRWGEISRDGREHMSLPKPRERKVDE
jgi:hypothetical protein